MHELDEFIASKPMIRIGGELKHSSSTSDAAKQPLTALELESIAAFLEQPAREGFWRGMGNWNESGEFSQFLFDEVKQSRLAAASAKGNKATAEQVKEEMTKEFFESIALRISPILGVFRAAHLFANMEDKSDINVSDKPTKKLVQNVDLKKLATKFPEAYKLYEEQFHSDDFEGHLLFDARARIKAGALYTFEGPSNSGRIVVGSTDAAPVIALGRFLRATGKCFDFKVERVFSPEEEVFQPYFYFLSDAFDSVIDDRRNVNQFKEAFQKYEVRDYIHCVSALGLVAEDYLIQIYESLFREPARKGLTLGQIFDAVHVRLKELTQPPQEPLTDLNVIFESLSEIESDTDPSANSDDLKRIVKAIRLTLQTIKLDRKYFDHRIKDLHARGFKSSVFPERIRNNIEEIIRNRNAASHKTRVPIGAYEALRTLYCLTSLVMWWKKEKKEIEWATGVHEILTSLQKRSET